jgi:hypothetical protein
VWRWGPEGYFWVPGTWVAPPQPGLLWTPGYWGLVGAVYVFHTGHWGSQVGYYGGINYGAGYNGDGYHGGRWINNRFQYNTSVTNVNVVNVHNTYNETVINNVNVNNTRVSYVGGRPGMGGHGGPGGPGQGNQGNQGNQGGQGYQGNQGNQGNQGEHGPGNQGGYGGWGGGREQPNPRETAAARDPRFAPTPAQVQHHVEARAEPTLNAARNEGRPPIAATPHPGAFHEPGATAAKQEGPAWHPQRPENQQGPHKEEKGEPRG